MVDAQVNQLHDHGMACVAMLAIACTCMLVFVVCLTLNFVRKAKSDIDTVIALQGTSWLLAIRDIATP